jgi:hypothetical protein
MKYLKLYNESVRDHMKPKSDEEIINNLDPRLGEIYKKSKELCKV